MGSSAGAEDARRNLTAKPRFSGIVRRPMSPLPHSLSPLGALLSLWHHRGLIWQMTQRDVMGRYRGSVMGLLWSFLNPLLMLGVYTFVFSVVFQARWGTGDEDKAGFAVILFTGMLIHTLFSECINRAPTLILGNVNYVKKVIFPLEALPWVNLGSALFHAAVSVAVLLVISALAYHPPGWTALLLPVLIVPLLLIIMGLSWFLASLAVFLRDVTQTTGMLTTVLLFLSPVFYPVSALPEAYRPFLYLNPLTFVIEQSREVLIWGRLPDWQGMGLYLVVSMVVAWLGFAWFQKTRKGFADVL